VALESVAIKRTAKAQLIAARQRLQAASEGELAADEAYRLGRFGYDAGRTSLMELLPIRRALTEAKLSTIEARLAHVKAMAALAQANGQLVFWGEAEK
jgi:cobalt-zinc-cadmium efflux system outer membrane protein